MNSEIFLIPNIACKRYTNWTILHHKNWKFWSLNLSENNVLSNCNAVLFLSKLISFYCEISIFFKVFSCNFSKNYSFSFHEFHPYLIQHVYNSLPFIPSIALFYHKHLWFSFALSNRHKVWFLRSCNLGPNCGLCCETHKVLIKFYAGCFCFCWVRQLTKSFSDNKFLLILCEKSCWCPLSFQRYGYILQDYAIHYLLSDRLRFGQHCVLLFNS